MAGGKRPPEGANPTTATWGPWARASATEATIGTARSIPVIARRFWPAYSGSTTATIGPFR